MDIISGEWIGKWGDRENSIFFIEVIGIKFKGYYIQDEKKVTFSGVVEVRDDLVYLIFSQPMSNNSGGIYYYNQDTLYIYCEQTKGKFFRNIKK